MPPANIFLDQNHWIYLAQDFWGRPHKHSHTGVAKRLLVKVERDEIRFPLNLLHLIELLRKGDASARRRLAEVFEHFSCGYFFAAWSEIIPVEILEALGHTFSTDVHAKLEVFGHGFMFGIGAGARERLSEAVPGINLASLSSLAAQPGTLFDLLTRENEINRKLQNARISQLNKTDAAAAEHLRAQRKPYVKDLHKWAQYAGYTLEFEDQIKKGLQAVGRSFSDFKALGLDRLVDFWSRVPSLDVDCELTLYRDRQWSRQVDANDVTDIGHMALAIPYCNAAVVERFWYRAIEETGLQKRYRTATYTDISDLASWV